jgi:hypothetical protein
VPTALVSNLESIVFKGSLMDQGMPNFTGRPGRDDAENLKSSYRVLRTRFDPTMRRTKQCSRGVSMNRSDIVSPRSNARVAPLRHAVAAALLFAGALIPLRVARAINVDPGDYAPAPPGTNNLLQYLQYTRDDGINIEGVGNLPAHLDSEIGTFRFVHFDTLFGMTVDPQIIIPYGSINSVQINHKPQNDSAGLIDPTIAMTLWPINRPDTRTYFGITPFITLPLGEYRRSDAINLGNNRYQGDIQIGYQSAFGSEGLAKKVVVTLVADAVFFSANTRSAIQSHAGLTQATLTQATGYQLQSWLTYFTDDDTNVSVGIFATIGGSSRSRIY